MSKVRCGLCYRVLEDDAAIRKRREKYFAAVAENDVVGKLEADQRAVDVGHVQGRRTATIGLTVLYVELRCNACHASYRFASNKHLDTLKAEAQGRGEDLILGLSHRY